MDPALLSVDERRPGTGSGCVLCAIQGGCTVTKIDDEVDFEDVKVLYSTIILIFEMSESVVTRYNSSPE
jgi:hypothetical protein